MIERFLLNEWDEMKKFYERSNKRNNLSKEMASNVQPKQTIILSVIMTKD